MSIKTWMRGSTVFSSDFLFNFRSLALFFSSFFWGILNQDTKHFIFQRSVSAFCFPPLNGQTVPVHNQTFSKGTFPPWIPWPLIFHSFLLRVWWTVDSPTPVLGSGQSVSVSVWGKTDWEAQPQSWKTDGKRVIYHEAMHPFINSSALFLPRGFFSFLYYLHFSSYVYPCCLIFNRKVKIPLRCRYILKCTNV